MLNLCVAIGYVTQIGWLGETGLGALAFLALPAWLIWLGIVFVKSGRAAAQGTHPDRQPYSVADAGDDCCSE